MNPPVQQCEPFVTPLTLGQIANRLGCQLWHVQRVFDRGLVNEAPRVGRQRVVYPDQIPAVRQALTDAGFLNRPVASGNKGTAA
jgi:hypothetical protein